MRVPAPRADALPFLPRTPADLDALGWDAVDVVFVTGDAYVDHPSFAMAILGRVLEAAGFRVAILSQPDWTRVDDFRALGRPRLFFAVSAGNMDSMLNRYTASKKPRSDDAYSEGGAAGKRPDRATNVYAQRCREAFPGVPVVAGGVEASLRRYAHYDYWSDGVKPSILLTSKADVVVFGMGEAPIVEIARRFAAGARVEDLRDLRSVAYLLGEKETLPPFAPSMRAAGTPDDDTKEIPSCEDVTADKVKFALATRTIHLESNPLNARRLLQRHGKRMVVCNPPALPLAEPEMDAIYDLRYARRPHPSYRAPIPAMEMMKTSVTLMRGCFGGCTFCSITTHQGRIIQSRSKASITREIAALGKDPSTKGIVSDIGGPTANMYKLRCTKPDVEAKCRRLSCVHPTVCKLLGTDHGPLIDLMKTARSQPGIRRIHVASGVRMDLARRAPEYLRELAAHHVGGHLKVAPEHVSPRVLDLMKKPSKDDFVEFEREFQRASRAVGKEQYLVPYFIASHPGSTVADMIELALFLKRTGHRPRQVQDFIPSPLDVATCMYWTELDPFSLEPVPIVKKLKDRKAQRALMQFFKPEHWFMVRDALIEAGRRDLIGDHPGALIPSQPPPEARAERNARANQSYGGLVHDIVGTTRKGADWDAFTGGRDGADSSDGDDDGGGGATRREERAPAPPRSVGYRPGRKGFNAKRRRST
ncbi:MAG: YgiQ family radical SAM protein [Planctomycetes bacterium]|nr:YgiQ family radical SAM protein [Planctomycetota bacterium]MCC7170982.1 YgiQ family radical SAM protein [Planctomycetota bacterium]